MKINFLGTNGWYTTATGQTICTLIETDKYYLVLDAGEGFWKLNDYVKKDVPVYLLLSHLHLDHVFGLHMLPHMKFKEQLTIVVPESKFDDLMALTKEPYTANLKSMPVEIIPIKTGVLEGFPFDGICEKLQHHDGSFGYRLKIEGKTITYCCDTGFCEEAIILAKDSDVLIHECSNKPKLVDSGWGHSSPEEAAKVAKEANVKKMMMTHFAANFYETLGDRQHAEKLAKEIFSNTTAAEDGMAIEL